MSTTTETTLAPPALLTAVHRYDEAAYHCRRMLTQYGAEARPHRVARGRRDAAWETVRGLVGPGAAYRIPGVLGERVLGWSEAGELEITSLLREEKS